MAYKWMNVSIDGYVSTPAYVDESKLWNGWLCPYFKAEDIHLIQKMLDMIGEGETIDYNEEEDAYVVHTEYEGDGEDWYYGEDVDGMHLYPIGAGIWIWDEED